MDLSLLPGLIYYLDKVKQAFFPLFFSDQGPELRVDFLSSSSFASGSPRHCLQIPSPFPLGEGNGDQPAGPRKRKGEILWSTGVLVLCRLPPSSGLPLAPFTKCSLLKKVLNKHLTFWHVRSLRVLAFKPHLRKMSFRHQSGWKEFLRERETSFSLWNEISPAISTDEKCHSHQRFLTSKCEWVLIKLWWGWGWGLMQETIIYHFLRQIRKQDLTPDSSVQFSHSVVSNSLQSNPWTAARQASLSITNS